MKMHDQGWEWFDAIRGVGDHQRDELAEAFARCFLSGAGCTALNHLRAVTLGRAVGPQASDAMLRHLEGQRQLVLYIDTLVAKGSSRISAVAQPHAE